MIFASGPTTGNGAKMDPEGCMLCETFWPFPKLLASAEIDPFVSNKLICAAIPK